LNILLNKADKSKKILIVAKRNPCESALICEICGYFLNFEFWSFKFVSDFEFRISCFLLTSIEYHLSAVASAKEETSAKADAFSWLIFVDFSLKIC